jgi:hypothetical protein
MAKDSELTDDELEELLVKQFKQQPGKCKMKPVSKFIKKDIVPPDENL